jgi:16S rRNA (cytidine1402-2'-O)-methyltransferase
MTKLHEDYWRGTLADAVVHAQTVAPRGEYALVIGPAVSNTADVTDFDIASELGARTGAGLSTRDAIDEVTNALGVARKRVYAIAVEK